MSRPRRLRGHEGCCSSNNIDHTARGGEYWDSPYVVGTYGSMKLAGNVTKAEQDAMTLIEGGALWSMDSKGNRLLPPPGLPHPAYDEYLKREQAALAVIANGGGDLNKIRDTRPMPITWYQLNGTPQNKAERVQHSKESGDPMGGHRALTLWCKPCSTSGEDFVEALNSVGDELATGMRVFAMVISYVPVFGTACSFVINAAVTLAQGEGVDQALLDAVGGALPGQPLSKMAFDSVRAIAEGKPIEEVGIALLPVDDTTKKTLTTAARIIRSIADGEKITDVALTQLRNQLPPAGQKALDVAKRVANGENVGAIAADLAAQEAKNSPFGQMASQTYESYMAQVSAMQAEYVKIRNTPGAVNSFVAQSAYQGASDSLPPALRDALAAGALAGAARTMASIEMGGFSIAEMDPRTLDAWEAKGRAIINSGARYRPDLDYNSPFNILLSDLRAGKTPITAYYHERWDSITNTTSKEEWSETFLIDSDLRRRGFDIGVGVAEGWTEKRPEFYKLSANLNLAHKVQGLEAGVQVQIQRTKEAAFLKALDNVAISMAQDLTGQDRVDLENAASKGVAMAKVNPEIRAARALNNDGRYRWGFDVGSGICQGMSAPGPGQTAWRIKVGPYSNGGGPYRGQRGSNEAMQGFDVAQALQHGMAKEKANPRIGATTPPAVSAGQLIAKGLSGSGSPSDLKVAVIGQTFTNSQTKQGATAVINQGFFSKFFALIGL